MSDPANWYEWIKVSAFVVGLVFGGFAVGSPSWVWLKKQLLPAIAGWLATLGTVLISISIWQSVEIEGAGLKVRIAELRDALVLQNALAERDLFGQSSTETVFRSRSSGVIAAALRDDPQLAQDYEEYLEKQRALQARFKALGLTIRFQGFPRVPSTPSTQGD